ncbi:hypothetical protein JAAARDRAFT_56530 [Jaapia argillacea MUCL 33604]|uniref:C3H1-type domain-containing protein n=1 Tax=Jaapia argillacea MUCL 33604 TaxID=933084 RepID=A0A067Q052_9AGAM|nr:hypothetical protein JAAARDRAFT_56530 [Jaapia argillacea MUCL 33604]
MSSSNSRASGQPNLSQPPDNAQVIETLLANRAAKRAARAKEKKDEAEALKEKGNKLFKDEDYYGAIDFYQLATQLRSRDPIYWSNLSAAFLKVEDFEEAEDSATRALDLDPKHQKARFRRALARKGQTLYKASVIDFEAVLRLDPNCEQAKVERDIVQELWEIGEGTENGNTTSDDEDPRLDTEKDDEWEEETASDSSDCNHEGNHIPCRFYNHDGCNRGASCAFSHAPDEKSVRDLLGKNVCLYYLFGTCKFGDSKCIYSHTKTYLPPGGWWESKEKTTTHRIARQLIVDTDRDLRALDGNVGLSRYGAQARLMERVMLAGKAEELDRREKGSGLKFMSEKLGLEERTKGAGRGSGSGARGSGGRGRGKGKGKGKGRGKHREDRPPKWVLEELDRRAEERAEERAMNYGFTESEVEELLCQGVKPWDDDAWDVMNVLNGGYY